MCWRSVLLFVLVLVSGACAGERVHASIFTSNSVMYLAWSGASNVAYQVEHAADLDSGSWTGGVPEVVGTGTTLLQTVAGCVGMLLPTGAFFRVEGTYPDATAVAYGDMLTPVFYNADTNAAFRHEMNRFVYYAGREQFHHPLENPAGEVPSFSAPGWGAFGATKPVRGDPQSYHPASDLYVGSGETNVELFAAHDGVVSVFRDADKYRHYLAITKNIVDAGGAVVGKISTLYGHIDLDLDEAGGLMLNGQVVEKGDLVSRNLYSETRGGPHLHFEIRYYRPDDAGDEEFYGGPSYSEPSSGPWLYGYWNPQVGYGFGHPGNHGLTLY